MTAATNETCIGWFHENCSLMGKEWYFWLRKVNINLLRGDFMVAEMSKFLAGE